ncbi:hypothetical protein [Methylophilus sp.]|uniref:hypothetical protein n=1 Tax=Methylophilus sp. TaxID=29541 RepID=UPI0040376552
MNRASHTALLPSASTWLHTFLPKRRRATSSAITYWCCSLLFAWGSTAQADLKDISRIYHSQPSLQAFEICQGGGCTRSDQLQLTPPEWDNVVQIFTPQAENAEQERQQIAQAIGMLEDIIGTKIGTTADRAGTFDNSDYQHQQDCNDEAINSTTYKRQMQQAGLIRLHTITDTRTRKFFFTGWPHSAAVIRENDSQAEFAVDSWFYDNGHAATIVPMALWKDGYIPADSPIRHRE